MPRTNTTSRNNRTRLQPVVEDIDEDIEEELDDDEVDDEEPVSLVRSTNRSMATPNGNNYVRRHSGPTLQEHVGKGAHFASNQFDDKITFFFDFCGPKIATAVAALVFIPAGWMIKSHYADAATPPAATVDGVDAGKVPAPTTTTAKPNSKP